MLSKELKLLDKTQKRRKSKHFFYVYLYMLHTVLRFCCRLLTFFIQISLGNKIKLSNCLDQDNSVGPDLDPNCFPILSADDKICC